MPHHTHDIHFQAEPKSPCEIIDDRRRPSLCQTDRLSFYRAIARHVIGDPTKHQYIHDAILSHYLQIFVDNQDPLHDDYMSYSNLKGQTIKSLFGALSCPDLVLCNCQTDTPMSKDVLVMITNALNARIIIKDHDSKLLYEEGPVQYPEYHGMYFNLGSNYFQHIFCSQI